MARTELAYANPAAVAPRLESLGGAVDATTRTRMLIAASIPLAISFGVQWVFFISYWVPETSGVPGHRFWLTQLAPLTSRLLTSAGSAQVPAETGWWDVPALVLLICSLAVYVLCRTPRFWLGPAGLAVPALLGTLVAVGSIVAIAVGGDFGSSWLSVLLLVVWVGAAAYASVRKIFDDPAEHAEPSLRESLLPLAVYVVIGPAPTAVGRMLFGRPLRDAAVELQGNTLTGRLAAVLTPTTVLLYLCGLLVGIAVWIAWEWWPTRRRLPGYALALAIMLAATVAIGWPASSIGRERAATLRDASPASSVHFSCGTMQLDGGTPGGPGRPARTLVITGFSCRTVTTFVGYRQVVPSQTLPAPASPVSAYTPEGVKITSRLVTANYDSAVVLAGSSRIDKAPDRLFWLDPVDGHLTWEFVCGTTRTRPLFVRFAQVPGGDKPELGHVTQGETRPTVVVNCEGLTYAIDPAHPQR